MMVQVLENDKLIWESDIYENGCFPDALSSGVKGLIEEKGGDIISFNELEELIARLKVSRSQIDDLPFTLTLADPFTDIEGIFCLKHREGALICLQSIYDIFTKIGLKDLKVRLDL